MYAKGKKGGKLILITQKVVNEVEKGKKVVNESKYDWSMKLNMIGQWNWNWSWSWEGKKVVNNLIKRW